jgi:zinc protease
MTAVLDDPHYFSEEDFALVKTRLEDKQLLDMETADQLISSLSFWWASASTEYYLGYIDNLKKVTIDDVRAFIRKYISGRDMLMGVVMNPADYAKNKEELGKNGFTEIRKSTAFWWSQPGKGGNK